MSRPGLRVLLTTGYAEAVAAGSGCLEAGRAVLTGLFSMGMSVSHVREVTEARVLPTGPLWAACVL